MRCPFCAHEDSQVKDSRPSEDGAAIRRRRQCEACGARFTTFERVQLRDLTVVKKAGEREPFERDKLARSIAIACRKRDISPDRIDRLISSIQRQLETRGDEVTTSQIGEAVMDALKAIDHVAYIRFASVYKDFTEPGDFAEIVEAVGEEARSEESGAQPGKPQGSPDRLL
ncbi:MAG: transcriptional repressor NrdR [Sphingomonadales bacterium]|jgi:transcriptional repressor NrdR|nr:transcriptional repressor NrdR [Sphingomonadales bacterium]